MIELLFLLGHLFYEQYTTWLDVQLTRVAA